MQNDLTDVSDVAKLSDAELIEIWASSADPEHPTELEEAAVDEMERRDIDF